MKMMRGRAMSKTIALISVLMGMLKTKADNVYYEEALRVGTNPPLYPNVVFELNEVTSDDSKTVLRMELNVVDYGKIRSTVETISDNIQTLLDKYYHMDENIQFVIYKDSRQTIKEEDKLIIRRRLVFEIQLHEIGGE